MNKTMVLWIVLAVAATLMMESSVWAQTLKIRFAGNMPAQNANSRAMVVFKEEIEKLSGGKVQVDFFLALQLLVLVICVLFPDVYMFIPRLFGC